MGDRVASRRRCPRCGDTTGELYCPSDGCATMLAVPAERLPEPRGGLVVGGRYRLVERVGQGAHGTVFSASHVLTGQPAAVKLLTDASEFDAIRRFLTEAQAMARLASPNTVHVRDFGQDDSGLVYLAMELLSGRTLRAELDRRQARGRRVEIDEVVWLAEGVLDSLTDAHARGLVHRDLKPSNVYLHLGLGGSTTVKVCDFGVVKVLDGGLSTQNHARGTPAYMSPEQATPGATLDGRSDLYSLGVILYELLAGRRPFSGDNALQLMRSHGELEVPPIRDPHVPAALAALVLRALAKRPDDRFADAAEARAALRALGVAPRAIVIQREDATATIDPIGRPEAALASLGAAGALEAGALEAGAPPAGLREAANTHEVSLEAPHRRAPGLTPGFLRVAALAGAAALVVAGAGWVGLRGGEAPTPAPRPGGLQGPIGGSDVPADGSKEALADERAVGTSSTSDGRGAHAPRPTVEAKPTVTPRPRRPASARPASDTLPFPIER